MKVKNLKEMTFFFKVGITKQPKFANNLKNEYQQCQHSRERLNKQNKKNNK